MSWDVNYESLNDIIKMEGNVITATYADKPIGGASERTYLICQALGAARRGETINLGQENQLCVAGEYWCGFSQEPHPRHLEFTMEQRRGYSSYTIAKRAHLVQKLFPAGIDKYIILAPIGKTTWEPDLVIFAGEPMNAHNLVAASTYDSGEVLESIVAPCACRSAIAYPLATNTIQIGLLDNGGRRWGKFKPEEMIVSMPVRWFYTILRNHEVIKSFGPPDRKVTLATLITGAAPKEIFPDE